MVFRRNCLLSVSSTFLITTCLLTVRSVPFALAQAGGSRSGGSAPVDLQAILREVENHQKLVEAMRESYTYDCVDTTQEIGSSGQVKKTDTEQRQEFFVNGHQIGRVVKRNGQPLSADDQQKENDRVAALIGKAQKTPPEQRLEGPSITVGRVLELMSLRNPRQQSFRGRPTIVFDFVGRRDMKTHGIMEDASKKLEGTVWIDSADLQVAHLEVRVDDNFRMVGGLLASVEKGSNFHFDQAPVDHGLWLPVGWEASIEARVLLLKNVHERRVQRDFGFQRFGVEAGGGAKTAGDMSQR
jgi:hypothetical protein